MKTLFVLLVIWAATPALAFTASAQTAWMAGLGGMHPNWATISSPSPCGVGCAEVRWNYLWVANGVKALDAYDASHPGANVYYGFSASSNIMIKSLMGKPNDMSDHYYLLGTPESSAERGFSLPTGDYSNVDFVAVQGDSVVFGNGNGNTFARHLSGVVGRKQVERDRVEGIRLRGDDAHAKGRGCGSS